MTDLPPPDRVGRPDPIAYWDIGADELDRFIVSRTGGDVRLLTNRSPSPHHLSVASATQLAAAIAAAAAWTDDDVVSAEIVDDRPRIEREMLVDAMVASRPPWMTCGAARTLASDLVNYLRNCAPVVIVEGGREWPPSPASAPDTPVDNLAHTIGEARS